MMSVLMRRSATTAARQSTMVAAVANKHTLPDLPYDYGALEPGKYIIV